jgi:hypothetical protein
VSDVTLHDVLFVPGLSGNLFSVRAATSKGYSTVTKDNYFRVMKADRVVVEGFTRDGSLYHLGLKPKVTLSHGKEAGSKRIASMDVWHQRLGHVNQQYLQDMVRKKSVYGLDVEGENKMKHFCESCVFGKQTRKSLASTGRKRMETPGRLVHADVCGPMSVSSIGGSTYFLLFKDDASDYRVYCIRTDNGLEFCNTGVTSLLRENKIRHERTTAYTPEQKSSESLRETTGPH